MSIVRKSRGPHYFSDIYIYGFDDDLYCCGNCLLHPENKTTLLHSKQEIIDHMDAHRAAGHRVPDSAYRILEETYDEDD